jgi:hypothetical protein
MASFGSTALEPIRDMQSNGNKNKKDATHAPDGAFMTLRGSVAKIIRIFNGSDEAEIVIDGAESLYREIRIQNLLQNANGDVVALKPGAEVEITIRLHKS